MTDDLHRSELYRAFIGEGRTDYYLKRFAAFDEQGGGFYRSWHWGAFFVGPLWAVFRKMHSVYWLFGLIALFGTVTLRFSAAHYFLLLSLTWIALTLYANALYYRHAKRMISRAEAKGLAGQDLLSHLESAGDVDYANSAVQECVIGGSSSIVAWSPRTSRLWVRLTVCLQASIGHLLSR